MIHETNECQPQIQRGGAFKENEAAFWFSDDNRSDKLVGMVAHQLAITLNYKMVIIICYESETLRGLSNWVHILISFTKDLKVGLPGSTGQRKENLI